MKGRKPYPAAVMRANNDTERLTEEQLRVREENEPKLRSNEFKCPEDLCDEAKAEWERLARYFQAVGTDVYCDLDCNILEVYCNAVVMYRKAMRKIAETSEVYVQKRDRTPRKNPWLTIANQQAKCMCEYAALLLLTPTARAKVGVLAERNPSLDNSKTAQWFRNRPDELKKY